MKTIFDFGRRADGRLAASILCLLFILVAGGGCGKSQSSPPPAAPSPASNSTPTAAVPTGVPTAEPIATSTATRPTGPALPAIPSNPAASGLTQLQLLNRVLLGWEMQNHRRPQTFEEFASTTNYKIPDPPPGKKYAFSQRGFIILVNTTQ